MKILENNICRIEYSSTLQEIAEATFKLLERKIPEYEMYFDIKIDEKIKINYFDDLQKFRDFIYNIRKNNSLPEYATGTYDKESVDLDSIQKKLKFSGLPKTIVYSGSKAFPDIFDFLKGLLDWLVGLLFLGLKIFAMGLTEICENIVNNLMHAVANTTISISN